MIPKSVQNRQAKLDRLMNEFLKLSPVPVARDGRPWIALYERHLNLECWVFDGQAGRQFPDTQVATLSRDGKMIIWHGRAKAWGTSDPEHHQNRDWPCTVAASLVAVGQLLLDEYKTTTRSSS